MLLFDGRIYIIRPEIVKIQRLCIDCIFVGALSILSVDKHHLSIIILAPYKLISFIPLIFTMVFFCPSYIGFFIILIESPCCFYTIDAVTIGLYQFGLLLIFRIWACLFTDDITDFIILVVPVANTDVSVGRI